MQLVQVYRYFRIKVLNPFEIFRIDTYLYTNIFDNSITKKHITVITLVLCVTQQSIAPLFQNSVITLQLLIKQLCCHLCNLSSCMRFYTAYLLCGVIFKECNKQYCTCPHIWDRADMWAYAGFNVRVLICLI